MERRNPGRPTDTPSHGRLLLWTLGYTLVAFVLLSMQGGAFAAELVDVRVGEHKGYTRLVLELDSLAAYQVSEPRDGANPVMKVELDARGEASEFKFSQAIVEAIRIEPAGNDTAIHVHLKKAEVQINEMILLSPPRLVFDLRDPAAGAARGAKPAAAKATPATAAAAKSAVTPKAAPPSRPAPKLAERPSPPKPAAAPATPAQPATQTAAGMPPRPRKPIAVIAKTNEKPGAPAPSTSVAAPAQSGEPSEPAPTRREVVSPPVPAPGAGAQTPDAVAVPGQPLALDGAATGRPNALAIPGSAAPRPAASALAEKLQVPPLPSQRRAASGQPDAAVAGESGGGLVAKLQGFVGGLNKLVLAGVGVVAALLVFFVIRRGRGGDDALSPVMSAHHLGNDGDNLFGGPEAEATEPVPTARSTASAPPPPPPVAASGGNLESRVAQLEATLQQLAQAREAMERQLAAQTEELRVQRAAIARTQRVVRSFGDADEDSSGATEPVPRVPAS